MEPLSTAEAFVTVILTLVGEASVLLEQRGEGARRLDLVFERIDTMVQVVRLGTARPVRDVRHLAQLEAHHRRVVGALQRADRGWRPLDRRKPGRTSLLAVPPRGRRRFDDGRSCLVPHSFFEQPV